MNIHITKPEVEALINQRLKCGMFKDAEDVILVALQALAPKPPTTQPPGAGQSGRSLREVFETVRGLADDEEFSRNPSTGRPVDLA